MADGKPSFPVGYVYRLRVEPDWGLRGCRTEYEFFFAEKLDRADTRSFLEAEKLDSFHHDWSKIHYGSRNRAVTNH